MGLINIEYLCFSSSGIAVISCMVLITALIIPLIIPLLRDFRTLYAARNASADNTRTGAITITNRPTVVRRTRQQGQQAMSAADDFMREIEDSAAANKSKRWLNERATDKQRDALRRGGVQVSAMDFSWTKYKAACWLNYLWNKEQIDAAVERIAE